jgi:hypothetical protein
MSASPSRPTGVFSGMSDQPTTPPHVLESLYAELLLEDAPRVFLPRPAEVSSPCAACPLCQLPVRRARGPLALLRRLWRP